MKRAVLRSTKRGREVLATDYLHDLLQVMEKMNETNEELLAEVKDLKEKVNGSE